MNEVYVGSKRQTSERQPVVSIARVVYLTSVCSSEGPQSNKQKDDTNKLNV